MSKAPRTSTNTLSSLVIGGTGVIGAALVAHLQKTTASVISTTRRENERGPDDLFLDLSQPVSGFPLPPSLQSAFFCTGATGLKFCEENPDESRAVNVTHTLELAKRLVEAGVFTVYLSTSRTLSSDVYTDQKLEADRGFLSFGEGAAIVKLSKVFGPDTPLIQGWKTALTDGNVIEPFSDMEVAPLSAKFVANALAIIASEPHSGIINLGPAKPVTYADLARHLAENLGVESSLVQPVTAASKGIDTDLPMAGDLHRMESELGLTPPDPYDEFDKTFDLIRNETA